ncbi:MAG: outer membrane lipoprotein LolB [Gammaproteobacteria bacterium]|nr:outer membrane lipoprotein LolB [Gammaproteobacteria bacterium]
MNCSTRSRLSRSWRSAAICSLLALLSACSALGPKPPPSGIDYSQQQRQLAALDQWQLQGKLGIRLPEDAASAYIDWRQQPRSYEIQLSGPLGQGATRISATPDGVTLARAGEAEISAPSAEELMYRTLGWWLPMSDLHYWVRGIPSPTAPTGVMERNENGTLHSLTQSGWLISYLSYQAIPPFLLPARLAISRADIKATLIIKNWQLPQ